MDTDTNMEVVTRDIIGVQQVSSELQEMRTRAGLEGFLQSWACI